MIVIAWKSLEYRQEEKGWERIDDYRETLLPVG